MDECLFEINFNKSLLINCQNLKDLKYEGEEPFASGTKKVVSILKSSFCFQTSM